MIGHSCNSRSRDYHLGILSRGSYLGFDQFGTERLFPYPGAMNDEEKTQSLATLIRLGHGHRIVLSHDTVWCWRGQQILVAGPDDARRLREASRPVVIHQTVLPRLRALGIGQADIDVMLVDNPRRYFSDIAV